MLERLGEAGIIADFPPLFACLPLQRSKSYEMRQSSCVVALLLFIAGAAQSSENFPERAREQLRKQLPAASVLEWKIGSINADALKDIAVIVSTGETPTDSYLPTQALVVLYATQEVLFGSSHRQSPAEPYQSH